MTTYETGLHEGIPNAEYHRGLRANPKPLSASMAKCLVTKSPAEFKWEQDHRIEKNGKVIAKIQYADEDTSWYRYETD